MAKAKSKTPAKAATKSKSPAKKAAVKTAAKKVAAKPAAKASAKKAKPVAKAAAKKPDPKATAKKTVAKAAVKTSSKTAVKTAVKAAAKVAPKTKAKTGFAAAAVAVAAGAVAAVFGAKVASKSKTPNAKTLEGIEKAFSPLDDRVVIQREDAPTMTAGGLYIPDTATENDKPNRGRVLAVGLGGRDKKGRLRPLDVQMGDLVIFDRYAGSDISINGEELTVLREKDIVAIVN